MKIESSNNGTLLVINNAYAIAPPAEGEINIYYGRIGQGKTSKGTRNIIESLRKGHVVYANWRIKWNGYDERTLWRYRILGLLGLKKTFKKFPANNYHFWNFATQEIDGIRTFDFVTRLASLTDCDIHLDEGHIPFDSYEATKMDEKKRTAIFAMRHFNRSLTVYTQRANSVHINLRGNTNRFYKCEKIHDIKIPFIKTRFVQFLVTEFQDLTSSSTVDETRVMDEEGKETSEYKFMVSESTYWAWKGHFAKFDSKYLRGDLEPSQINNLQVYRLNFKERILNFIGR